MFKSPILCLILPLPLPIFDRLASQLFIIFLFRDFVLSCPFLFIFYIPTILPLFFFNFYVYYYYPSPHFFFIFLCLCYPSLFFVLHFYVSTILPTFLLHIYVSTILPHFLHSPPPLVANDFPRRAECGKASLRREEAAATRLRGFSGCSAAVPPPQPVRARGHIRRRIS